MNTTAAETSITAATQAVRRHRSPVGSSALIVRIEAVADRTDRGDRRSPLFPGELAPQVADVHVHDVGAWVILVAPDRAEDLLTVEHVAAVAHQVDEQLELGCREPHRSEERRVG